MERHAKDSQEVFGSQSQNKPSRKHLVVSKQREEQQLVYRQFAQQIGAIVLTRGFLLAPLERMKIVLQVNALANFANPSDRPKGALDLSNKISVNQGMMAYFRGNNALIYKLVVSHAIKFTLYETIFQGLQKRAANNGQGEIPSLFASIGAATATSLLTTCVTYPLDLAHGRMAADMSKRASVVAVNKQTSPLNRPSRLYSSVRECLTKTQEQQHSSRKYQTLLKGLPSALIAQVPYKIVLFGCFEIFDGFLQSQETHFNKRDGEWFLVKYLTRFGASTLSLLLAQSLCYPLDTVKRRMQLNGAQGFKNVYKTDYHCLQKVLKEEGLRKGLYAGFSVNLVRCLPLTLIQFIMFQNLRFLSKRQPAGSNQQHHQLE